MSGERRVPRRALPEPFCLYGLRPPPRTSLRVSVLEVPCAGRVAREGWRAGVSSSSRGSGCTRCRVRFQPQPPCAAAAAVAGLRQRRMPQADTCSPAAHSTLHVRSGSGGRGCAAAAHLPRVLADGHQVAVHQALGGVLVSHAQRALQARRLETHSRAGVGRGSGGAPTWQQCRRRDWRRQRCGAAAAGAPQRLLLQQLPLVVTTLLVPHADLPAASPRRLLRVLARPRSPAACRPPLTAPLLPLAPAAAACGRAKAIPRPLRP